MIARRNPRLQRPTGEVGVTPFFTPTAIPG
jgi:hypothetical protein